MGTLSRVSVETISISAGVEEGLVSLERSGALTVQKQTNKKRISIHTAAAPFHLPRVARCSHAGTKPQLLCRQHQSAVNCYGAPVCYF